MCVKRFFLITFLLRLQIAEMQLNAKENKLLILTEELTACRQTVNVAQEQKQLLG